MSKLQGAVTPVLLSTLSPIIAVASTGVVYTKSFPLFNGEYFGLWVQIASATGTPDVKIDLEQSWKEPTTEGSAETILYEVTQAITAGINDKLAHNLTVSPKPMAFGRFKITGINSNPADAILTGYKFIQE